MSIQELIKVLRQKQSVITDEHGKWKYGEWFVVSNGERFEALMFVQQLTNNHTVVEDTRGTRRMIPDDVLDRHFAGRVVRS